MSCAYLPSLCHHPPKRTGEDRAEAAAGLKSQRAVEVRLRTSMFGPVQRALSRIADTEMLMKLLEAGALGYPTLLG